MACTVTVLFISTGDDMLCVLVVSLLTLQAIHIAYIAMLMHILGTIIIMLRVHNVCHMKTRHKGLFLPKSRCFAFWPFRLST